jgi:hypothetical protein
VGSRSALDAHALGRLAAVFYLVNILTGAAALFLRGVSASVAVLVASLAYLVVTVLFQALFRPAEPGLSALVAVPSLIGCSISILSSLGVAKIPVNPLGFFGLYCLGLGWLILRTRLIPRPIGMFLLPAGLSWLTFFLPSLAKALAPYNMAPGILAEVTLTSWLLYPGIASARGRSAVTGA